MELTKEQLQIVEKYLNAKGIEYLDIRLEILDHIISDIETIMKNESLAFELVFASVKNKWNSHFKDDTSFYFGITYSAPKIVIEKAKKIYKNWFFIPLIVFLFPYILVGKLNFVFQESITYNLNLFSQIIVIINSLVFIYLLFMNSKNKSKSTYSFILKTQNFNILLGVMILINFNIFNKEGVLDGFQVSLLSTFIYATYSYYFFYKKHKQVLKKYKIS